MDRYISKEMCYFACRGEYLSHGNLRACVRMSCCSVYCLLRLCRGWLDRQRHQTRERLKRFCISLLCCRPSATVSQRRIWLRAELTFCICISCCVPTWILPLATCIYIYVCVYNYIVIPIQLYHYIILYFRNFTKVYLNKQIIQQIKIKA